MRHWFAMTAVAVALTAAASAPGQATTRQMQEEACYYDAARLCKDAIPDEAKVQACMEKKKAQLSPKCAALFDADNAQ